MENITTESINESLLKELGFETAAREIELKKILKRKLMIAYENYRYVTSEQIQKFNEKLYGERNRNGSGYVQYDQLRFTSVTQYKNVPPMEVLGEIKKAIDLKCFDSLEIADIESVEVRPDPIVFGKIHGCTNRFFIAQWDNDVKIQDILKDSEG